MRLFVSSESNPRPNWRKIEKSYDFRKSATFYKFWGQAKTHARTKDHDAASQSCNTCFQESMSLGFRKSIGKGNSFVLQYRYLWLFFHFFCSLLYHSVDERYGVSFSSYPVYIIFMKSRYHRRRANEKQKGFDANAKIKLDSLNLI